MSAIIVGGAATIVRASIPLEEFPSLRRQHKSSYKTTEEIEKTGKDYVDSNFSEDKTEDFVKEVCRWGNYAGIWGKVLTKNHVSDIREHFKFGYSDLQEGKIADAISHITKITGLGVSFGSKHLKFLDPDRAVVLDSILSSKLAYSLDPAGYKELLNDCNTIRDELNAQNILRACGSPWRVSDVEMAIFMHVNPPK